MAEYGVEKIGILNKRNPGINTDVSENLPTLFAEHIVISSRLSVVEEVSPQQINSKEIKQSNLEEFVPGGFIEEVLEEEPQSIEQRLLRTICDSNIEEQDLITKTESLKCKSIIGYASKVTGIAFLLAGMSMAFLLPLVASLLIPVLIPVIVPSAFVVLGVISTAIAHIKKKQCNSLYPLNDYKIKQVFATSKSAKVIKSIAIVMALVSVASFVLFAGFYAGFVGALVIMPIYFLPTISVFALSLSIGCFIFSVGKQNKTIKNHLMNLLAPNENIDNLSDVIKSKLDYSHESLSDNKNEVNNKLARALSIFMVYPLFALASQFALVFSLPVLLGFIIAVVTANYGLATYYSMPDNCDLKVRIARIVSGLFTPTIVILTSLFLVSALPFPVYLFFGTLMTAFVPTFAIGAGFAIFGLLGLKMLCTQIMKLGTNTHESEDEVNKQYKRKVKQLKVANFVVMVGVVGASVTYFATVVMAGFATFSIWPLILAGAIIATSIIIYLWILKLEKTKREELEETNEWMYREYMDINHNLLEPYLLETTGSEM